MKNKASPHVTQFDTCHKYARFVSFITKEDTMAYSRVLFLKCVTELFLSLSGEKLKLEFRV
jgi:hypothetical protein